MFDSLNSYKVYIQTFDDTGNYTGTWTEITRHVISLGNTGVQIDSSDYDVGVFRNSNLTLKLNNRDGLFNDITFTESIFNFQRKDTLVKITYSINEFGPECGVVTLPFLIGEEVTVFKGLLNDESLRTSATQEDASFKVLGYESLFDRVLVNYSDLAGTEDVEGILYTILNQTTITGLLTVTTGNINCGLNQTPDDYSSLEGQTVKEALEDLLLVSNSILYIDSDDNVIIADRTASTTSQATFYGQASQSGAEDILNIKNYNNGIHRVFNYWLWEDTTTSSSDTTSITNNGLLKKEIKSDLFTNTTKIGNFLDALLAEFKDKKIEMEITVPLTYTNIGLNLLDKVNIDYPVPVSSTTDEDLPVLGIAVLGTAVLPKAQWALEISSDTDFKILSKQYNFTNHSITFKVREV